MANQLDPKLVDLQVQYITGKLTLPELIKKAHSLGYSEAYCLSDNAKSQLSQMQALGRQGDYRGRGY